MRLKSLLTGFIALITFAAITATLFAANEPAKVKRCAFGSISFADGQVSAEGDGFTVTRQGVGLYTIKYKTPFAQTPRLVIDPVQRSVDLTQDEFTPIEDGGTDAFAVGCIVTAQSATGASITCAGLDSTSRVCTDYVDEFGNIVTVCVYTRLNHADIPFNFAAFGD